MVRNVSAHQIATDRIEETRMGLGHLTRRLGSLATNPTFLPTFAAMATDVAGVLLTLDQDVTGVEWLRRSARVRALLVGRIAFPTIAPPIEIAQGVSIAALAPSPNIQEASGLNFVDALWCAMAVGDTTALSWLTNVPEGVLLQIGVQLPKKSDEYFFPLAETLRAVATSNGRHAAELIRTLEAMPPPGRASSRCEQIDEQAVRALFALLEGDHANYHEALARLFEHHRKYWESNGAPRGAISLPACALERLARARGVPALVTSAYAPPAVWS